VNRILSIIKKDYTLALRDSIALYIIIGPLLLAFAVRLFLPSVEDVKFNMAAEQSISSQTIEALSQYGEVEIFDSKDDVIHRVNMTDAIPGLVLEEGQIRVIFEGNEPQATIQTYTTLLEKVLLDNSDYALSSLSDDLDKPMLYGLMSTIIIMTALFLGGTVSGFNMVAEKDTKVIRSMAVTPLKMHTYLFSRGIVAIVTSLIIGLLSAIILSGITVNYFNLTLVLLASSPLIVIITLMIGRLADNQINSIAAIKIIMPVYLTLPLASLFIPQSLQVILYPLPNYWAFISLQSVFNAAEITGSFYMGLLALFISGSLYLFILTNRFRKHFGLR